MGQIPLAVIQHVDDYRKVTNEVVCFRPSTFRFPTVNNTTVVLIKTSGLADKTNFKSSSAGGWKFLLGRTGLQDIPTLDGRQLNLSYKRDQAANAVEPGGKSVGCITGHELTEINYVLRISSRR
jgi:hypothetical protein